jgi:hypothetical protein
VSEAAYQYRKLNMSAGSPTNFNYAYLAIPTVLGLAHAYKNFTQWLDDILKPETKAEFLSAESQCFDSNEKMFENSTFESYLKRSSLALITDEVPFSVIRTAGVLGNRATPQIPWYLYGVSQMSDFPRVWLS